MKNSIESNLDETCDNNETYLHSCRNDRLNEHNDEGNESEEEYKIYEKEEIEVKDSSNWSWNYCTCVPRNSAIIWCQLEYAEKCNRLW